MFILEHVLIFAHFHEILIIIFEFLFCFTGHQIRDYVCERDSDAQIVSSSKCEGQKPVARHRTCNFNCQLT